LHAHRTGPQDLRTRLPAAQLAGALRPRHRRRHPARQHVRDAL